VYQDADGHLAVGDTHHACSLLSRLIGFHASWRDSGSYNTWTLDEFSFLNFENELRVDYTYTTYQETYWHKVEATYRVVLRVLLSHDSSVVVTPRSTTSHIRGYRTVLEHRADLVKGHHDVKDGTGTWWPTAMNPYSTTLQSLWSVGEQNGSEPFDTYEYFTSAPYGAKTSSAFTASLKQSSQAVKSDVDSHGDYWYAQGRAYRSAYFFAYQDAIESMSKVLKTNYIQTLSKVSGVKELIPDGRMLVTALMLLYKRDPAGLVKLGDFIASEHLKWNFGTAPNLRSLDELNRQGPKLRRLFSQGLASRTVEVHGLFRYRFEKSETKYDTSLLECRCTTSLTYSPTPFMQVLMDLYGVGLMPTFSRIWEIIPFSFVADWFTHAKDRIKTVDTAILQLAFRHNYAIYSTTITSGLSPVCGSYRFCEKPEDVKLVYFDRVLTDRTPPLYDGGLDLLRVTGNPNTGILAALLYQLLK